MKTAISVPDGTYARVTQRARELGISRSQLFTEAADRFLDELDGATLTQQIDEALQQLTVADDSAAIAVAASRRMLEQDEEDW